MKKIFLSITLICLLMSSNKVFAQRTDSKYFTATCAPLKWVISNNNTISVGINTATGALSSSITPTFKVITNSREQQSLTMSANANIENNSTNAIFDASGNKYIILTNSTNRPSANAISDIKSGSPTASKNANAIAYRINEPQAVNGVLAVNYNSSNDNWDLKLTHRGQAQTSITVPAGTPLSNTYSINDTAGSYQATITLSFE